MSSSFAEHTAHAQQTRDERRRRLRSPESMEVDLRLWSRLRGSWRDIERSARNLGDFDRVERALNEIARADAAIQRLQAQLKARH